MLNVRYNMHMTKVSRPNLPRQTKGRMLLLVFFLLLLYVVVPKIGDFSTSWQALLGATGKDVVAAAGLVVATYIFAACMYYVLAAKPLLFWRTCSIQAASAFANRLLPAGLGGLTLNIRYLRKSHHTLAQAIAVAGVVNLLGFLGHALLLAVVVVAGGASFTAAHTSYGQHVWIALLVVAVIVAASLVAFQWVRMKVYKLIVDILSSLAQYRKRPIDFGLALFTSMALTCTYVIILYFSVRAVGFDMSIASMFIVFTLGMLAGTITPTPGGLGGTEAGLFAGLVAYQINSADALAAVLLFRLLTYWLPLLPGFVFFVTARKRYL